MKRLRFKIGLQFFADDGGDGGGAESGVADNEGSISKEAGGELPMNIPERARRIYEMTLNKAKGDVDTKAEGTVANKKRLEAKSNEEEKRTKPTFKELLKDEEYSKEYDRRVNKAVFDRHKKNDEKISRLEALLEKNARKYGIDTHSEGYLEELEAAMDRDDSFYERYAEEHDVSIETAKRMVGTEEQLKRLKNEERARKEVEQTREIKDILTKNAEVTKAKYPNFDLETEMKDPLFRQICAATGHNTSAAYFAVHHDDIMQSTVARAVKEAEASTVRSIRANGRRPSENGIAPRQTINTLPDFKAMSREELDAWAHEQRRINGR